MAFFIKFIYSNLKIYFRIRKFVTKSGIKGGLSLLLTNRYTN